LSKKILFCLKNKTKNKRKLQKYIMQLEILSNLRNLQPEITKQLSTVSINYDITKDLRFQEGINQGIEQGIEKKEHEFAISLIRSTDFDDSKIATLVGVEEIFIKNIRKALDDTKK
jgi:flagellar biosynthesis/type III secretory pathway protein FliH